MSKDYSHIVTQARKDAQEGEPDPTNTHGSVVAEIGSALIEFGTLGLVKDAFMTKDPLEGIEKKVYDITYRDEVTNIIEESLRR